MLLVIDVGNTHITLGVFEKEELKGTFRMTTRQSRTSDEYGILMCNMLEYRGIRKELVDDVIISSVVPDVMHSLTSGIIKYFHIMWDRAARQASASMPSIPRRSAPTGS